MKPRIVITGVAGFIGSNLADRLIAEGYRVVGVDDLSYGVRSQVPDGVELHELDIRDLCRVNVLRRGDVVFHLAAKNCISDCQHDPLAAASTNVAGTVAVFEAARQAGAAKVIYAESSALYEGATRLPTPEDELHPHSFYAVSKAAARLFADAYHRFHGMTFTALRYFCVYGPRQDYRRTIPPVISAFILRLMRGERPIIYGTGEKRRDFVHVDDVNDFHLRCITDPRTGNRTFNVGTGVSYSVNEIFDRIAAVLGSDLEPEHQPDLPGEALETLADIAAARELGWSPRIALADGVVDLARYYRDTRITWTV